MLDPKSIEEHVTVAKATVSCSVKITRKGADGDITSIESMNSMTSGELELSAPDAAQVMYALTKQVAVKCYADLFVHEMITARELQAAKTRIEAQYGALSGKAIEA